MNVQTRIAVEEELHKVPKRRAEQLARALPVQRLSRLAHRISPLGEVGRTLTAVLTASASMFALPAGTGVEVYLAVYWDVWAATYLALTWVLIFRSSPRQTRRLSVSPRQTAIDVPLAASWSPPTATTRSSPTRVFPRSSGSDAS